MAGGHQPHQFCAYKSQQKETASSAWHSVGARQRAGAQEECSFAHGLRTASPHVHRSPAVLPAVLNFQQCTLFA